MQVFSDKDYSIFSVIWSAGDVKEPTLIEKSTARSSRCCGLALSHELVLHIGLTSLHLSPKKNYYQITINMNRPLCFLMILYK